MSSSVTLLDKPKLLQLCELITCEKLDKENTSSSAFCFLGASTASNIFIWRKVLWCDFFLMKIKDAGDSWKLEQAASWDGQAAEKNSLLLFELPYIFSKFLNRPRRTIHRMSLKTGYRKKCWFCFSIKVATVGEDELRFWSCWSELPASRPLWCVKGNARKLWTDTGKTIQIWSLSSCNFLGSIHFFSWVLLHF